MCTACKLVDAVMSGLRAELRLWEGRGVRDGTLQIQLQALVLLRQVFP